MLKIPASVKFLLTYVIKYKYSYILGACFIILTNYLIALIPIYIKEVIDFIDQGVKTESKFFLQAILTAILLALSLVIIRTLSRVFFFNTARKIEYQLKNDLFQKVTRLPFSYFANNPAGKIISKINNDTLWVRLLCGFGVMQAVNILSAFSIIPYKMWKISPTITIYSIIFLILLFSWINFFVLYSMKFYLRRIKSLQRLSSGILATLSGIEIIQSYNVKDWSAKKFKEENFTLYNNAIKAAAARSIYSPLLNNTETLLKALIFYVGGSFFFQGDLSIGEITAMLSYTAFLTPPLIGLGWFLNVVLQSRLGLTSVYSIIKEKDAYLQIKGQKYEQVKEQFNKDIVIKNLSFAYPDAAELAVLKNINFKIKRGQILGILGSVGSGKTSLTRCLNKYVPVTKNSIFYGDLDIVDINTEFLRKLVRTVNQDAFLFSDTIANNILFGAREEKELSPQEWEVLFQNSALKSEIEIFPNGKETVVGEKGIMLSGGQKQRISFARSMMENCELLILDNVMSALDYETEDVLLNQIAKKSYSNRTLIISNRVRALSKADYILVLEKGEIVERGTTHELLANKKYFYKTWKIQNEKSS